MVEEGAGSGLDLDRVADAADVEAVERLDRALRLALGGAEGREVVAADQALRGFVHCIGIEGDRDPPG
jgi:hypothetical protein